MSAERLIAVAVDLVGVTDSLGVMLKLERKGLTVVGATAPATSLDRPIASARRTVTSVTIPMSFASVAIAGERVLNAVASM